VSASHVYPQAYISGAQAAKACAAAGKRLCAPVEWRTACTGPDEKKFGYGDTRVTGRCNDSGESPMLRLYPQVARSWKLVGMTEMNDPRLNQLEGTLAQTGSHEGCTNGYGVYDMVGNLHEWTNDPNGTFQGGYYLDTHINGDGCTYRTVAHEFTYHDYSTGFRCCAEPVVP
jgi:formylglycine-generating enzyme required for sulfatase activity